MTLSGESHMHSLRVVKMVLRSIGSHSMTGRKSICVLCFASSAWIVVIQPFQLECGNSGSWALIIHSAAQSVSPGVRSSGWSWARQEDDSAMGRNVMLFIPVCFLFVNGRIFTAAPFRILALSVAFNFTLGTAAVICGSGKGGAGEVTLIQPTEWKGVLVC